MTIHDALLTKAVTVVTSLRLAQFALYFAHLREQFVCVCVCVCVHSNTYTGFSHSLESKLIVN